MSPIAQIVARWDGAGAHSDSRVPVFGPSDPGVIPLQTIVLSGDCFNGLDGPLRPEDVAGLGGLVRERASSAIEIAQLVGPCRPDGPLQDPRLAVLAGWSNRWFRLTRWARCDPTPHRAPGRGDQI